MGLNPYQLCHRIEALLVHWRFADYLLCRTRYLQLRKYTNILLVNVSDLGLVTAGGKVVWGRWAQVGGFRTVFYSNDNTNAEMFQITNNCENDGCVNWSALSLCL
jgi:hypothetical protein